MWRVIYKWVAVRGSIIIKDAMSERLEESDSPDQHGPKREYYPETEIKNED